jgi:hypothetical protein
MNLRSHIFSLSALAFLASACDTRIEESSAQKELVNSQYDSQLSDLERRTNALEEMEDIQEGGYLLNRDLQRGTHDLLDQLGPRIPTTQVQDLPDWREMYRALAEPEARQGDPFTAGIDQLANNFSRQSKQLAEQDEKLKTHTILVKENSEFLQRHELVLGVHGKRLATIRNNLDDNLRQIDEKIAAVNLAVSGYDATIAGMEVRLGELETTFRQLREKIISDVNRFEDRMRRREDYLREYNLPSLETRIKSQETKVEKQGKSLVELEGFIAILKSSITNLGNNLLALSDDFLGFKATGEADVKALTELMVILQQDFTKLDSEFLALIKTWAEINVKKDQLKGPIADLVATLNLELGELAASLTTLETEWDKKSSQVEAIAGVPADVPEVAPQSFIQSRKNLQLTRGEHKRTLSLVSEMKENLKGVAYRVQTLRSLMKDQVELRMEELSEDRSR